MTDYTDPDFCNAVAVIVQPALDRMASKIAEQAVSRAHLEDIVDQINAALEAVEGTRAGPIVLQVTQPRTHRCTVETDETGRITAITDEPA